MAETAALQRSAEALAEKIRAWDTENVNDLLDMLTRLENTVARIDESGQPCDIDNYIDLTDLPTAPMPDDVDTSFPVWAMDKQGRMLVGDTADQIETLDEYRDYRANA